MIIQIPGIDTEKVLDLYDDDTDLYAAVLASCMENTPEVLDKLKEIAAELKKQSSDEMLAEYAVKIHGLKGTCGTIGAEDFKKEALELESMAKAGDLQGLLARNDVFLKNAYELIENIKKWLEQQ